MRDRFVDQEVVVYHAASEGAMWERRSQFYTVVCLGRAETQPLAAAEFMSRISVERFPWGLYTGDVETTFCDFRRHGIVSKGVEQLRSA